MLMLPLTMAAAVHSRPATATDSVLAATALDPAPSPSPSSAAADASPSGFVPWSGEAKAACEMQWTKAVAGIPSMLDEPILERTMRGDDFLSGLPPRVLFVHIGKSCGATVERALEHNSELLKLKGVGGFKVPEPFGRVHVHPVRRGVLDAAQEVAIVLRDPAERVISAYNTAACKEDDDVTDIKECLRAPAEQKFQRFGFKRLSLLECYPNVTAFADGLDDDSDCGRLARDVLQNNETHPESSHGEHVGMGSCFYVGGMTKMLTHKRIHLVETSTCDADIARIPARLGLTSPFKVMGEAHVGPFPHHSDAPSDEGMQRLRRHLAHEYALYYELKRLATSQASSEEGA